MDLADIVTLLGCQCRLQRQMREPDDGVHRRANFVAHVSQKHRLHLRRFFGFRFCDPQFFRNTLLVSDINQQSDQSTGT
ncbi:MAG: hypothetical protein ACK56R_08555, partial [Pirellulaceae bacterium]